jgi:hypothetical protein
MLEAKANPEIPEKVSPSFQTVRLVKPATIPVRKRWA